MANDDCVISPSLTHSSSAPSPPRTHSRRRALLPSAPTKRRPFANLTERGCEVLAAIATGWSNAEIATDLHLAESTVASHVSRILGKIDVGDHAQAVIFAYDMNLGRPTDPVRRVYADPRGGARRSSPAGSGRAYRGAAMRQGSAHAPR